MRTCFFYRNPIKYDLVPDVFLKPFSTSAWIAVVAMSILILLLSLISTELTWTNAIFAIVSTLCQQGSSLLPKSLLFLSLLLWSLLLYNYYSATMLSLLLNYSSPPFASLKELIAKLEMGVDTRNCYVTKWLKNNPAKDIELFNAKLRNFDFCTVDEAFARVAEGNFAYYTDHSTAYAIIGKTFKQDALCDLEVLKMIPSVPAGLVLTKRSQFFEMFQISLRRLHERGFVNRFGMFWEIKKPECFSNSEIVPVGLDQIRTAFLCLSAWLLLAMLIVVFETAWIRFRGTLRV